ncbi:site-specific integrase [Segetibacter sp.]|jgi:site-specific recombinase XerD|uniref:site-specific integrase n=1 Tax=Segetibacter sp. TaxID=2231182 RepID=UPI002627BEF5|nr:site-specific integrase [Segetibacter sp.]MCW3081709.1 integrase [Segetibacter sp.]
MEKKANTFSVIFRLRKERLNEEKFPIYARITINGKRIELATKQKIKLEDWNDQKGMAKTKKEEFKVLNNYLEQMRSSFVECYRDMTIKKQVINIDTFKKAYYGHDENEMTLFKLTTYHNQDMKDTICWGTLKNYFTTQKYLQKFLKERLHLADISLKDINYKFVTEFEYFLKSFKPLDHHKALSNNGVMKHMERFRKMINVALKNEWLEKDPFKAYKLKFTKYERGYLSAKELDRIERKNFEFERLQYVKDLFVFSCYTGLAYTDAMKLTPGNFIRGIDGDYWLTTQRQKTGTPVKIPLLPKAKEIIEKYKNNPKSLNDGTMFPNISNQRLNGYLKELADVCKIDKNLTFHLARHTFATTITLSNGVPIESVSKMLGHTKITTTQVYAKVIESKLSDDMKLLKQKLNDKVNEVGIMRAGEE